MEDKHDTQTTDRPLNDNLTEIQNAFEAEICFGFQITTSSISDLFENISQNLGFQMIQKEINHSTAIKYNKKGFLQYLDCFNWLSDGAMTAIKMTVHTSQKNSTRVCKVKGLVGSKKEVKRFLDNFKEKSRSLIRQQPFHMQDSEQILDEPDNPFHLEACAAYMFHKILSNEQYGIGNIISRSIKDYENKFNDVENSVKALPLPMKNATIVIKQVVENLYKDFNMGRKEMEKIMPYCRISVEKYVFDKIQKIIFPIYSQKVSEQMAIFQQKRSKIFNTKKLIDIFTEINLDKENWLLQNSAMKDFQASLERTYSKKQLRNLLKYKKGCEQLQKLTHVTNPREKMKHCQICYSLLKTIFYEGSSKQRQLTNMEDIIPIFILILLLSQIADVKAQIDMIVDFIEFDNCDLQSERRLMLNFSESFNYIYRDWKI